MSDRTTLDKKAVNKKPFVICHVISSLDGRISGSAFELPETMDAMDEHWKIRADFGCKAVMNGATTAAEIYADGCGGSGDGGAFAREDHIVPTELGHYVVCVDPEGTLRWSRNYVDRPVQPKSHVIEVLLENVSDAYLEYLRGLDISYIFAGRDRLDVDLLMEKLVDSFGIDRLLITGGGMIDWTMLDAGIIDEISVIITPTVGGERDVSTMFDRTDVAFARGDDTSEGERTGREGVSLELIDARKLGNGSMHLRYRPIHNR